MKQPRQYIRECHKCPRNGKGDPYCYEKCLGPAEISNKGINKVSLGGMRDEESFIYSNLPESYKASIAEQDNPDLSNFVGRYTRNSANMASSQPITKSLSESTENALRIVLADIFALDDIQLCILRHLFLGENYAEIGKTLPYPISKQAVCKRIHIIARKFPVFRKLLNMKSSKRIDTTPPARTTTYATTRRKTLQTPTQSPTRNIIPLEFDF